MRNLLLSVVFAALPFGCGSPEPEERCDPCAAGDADAARAGSTYWIDPSEPDQGVHGGGGTLAAIVDGLGSGERATLVLAHDGPADTTTYTLVTSLAVPHTIVLRLENGAVLDGAGTLTVHSPAHIDAGSRQQIFGSSVSVVYETTGTVFPDWYRENLTPGGTNMAPAIQAAIDDVGAIGTPGTLGQGGVVSLAGEYSITATLRVDQPGVYIVGNGTNSTEIVNWTDQGHAIHFAPPDPTAQRLDFGGVRDLTITYAHAVGRENPAAGAAIFLRRYSHVQLQGLHLRDHFRGVDICGDGQVVLGDSIIMQGVNTTAAVDGSTAIYIGRGEVEVGNPNGVVDARDGRTYTEPNSIYIANVNIRNIVSYAGYEDALFVDAVDGLYLSNVHLNGGSRSGLHIQPAQDGLPVGNIMSDGLFIDPIDGFGAYGIWYEENPVLVSPQVNNHLWANTIVDNADEYGVLMQGAWRNIVFNGGNVRNSGKHGFHAQQGTGLTISNIAFRGHNASGGTFQNVNLLDVTGALVSGCRFEGAYRGVQIAGDSSGCLVSGCTFGGQGDPGVNRSVYLGAEGQWSNQVASCISDTPASADAATDLQFPVEHDTIYVTGASGIHGIDTDGHFNGYCGYEGRRVTLVFDGTPLIYDASDPNGVNIYLADSANFAASAQDTLTLVFRGNAWYEVARSVN